MNTRKTSVAGLDADMLARIEDAGINASAPPQQRWVDGWLVRLSPGKAKRARCIQAVATGRLGIDAKLALCLPLFAAAGLRPYVRITPFSEPAGLDDHLDALGMVRIDDTMVMARASLRELAAGHGSATPSRLRAEPASAAEFADWVGRQRGSTATERQAHVERLAQAAVPHQAVLLRDEGGAVVAGGQLVVEGAIAGLYDVFTTESQRGHGHAEHLCRHLLASAVATGASVGYLQVDAANHVAHRLYGRLGFVDAYAYHYRSPPEHTA